MNFGLVRSYHDSEESNEPADPEYPLMPPEEAQAVPVQLDCLHSLGMFER